MSGTRVSAVDRLRLVSITSVSPEGTADEVRAILQRTVTVGSETFANARLSHLRSWPFKPHV